MRLAFMMRLRSCGTFSYGVKLGRHERLFRANQFSLIADALYVAETLNYCNDQEAEVDVDVDTDEDVDAYEDLDIDDENE